MKDQFERLWEIYESQWRDGGWKERLGFFKEMKRMGLMGTLHEG